MLNGISNFHGDYSIVKNKAVISSHASSPTIIVESSTQEPLNQSSSLAPLGPGSMAWPTTC